MLRSLRIEDLTYNPSQSNINCGKAESQVLAPQLMTCFCLFVCLFVCVFVCLFVFVTLFAFVFVIVFFSRILGMGGWGWKH